MFPIIICCDSGVTKTEQAAIMRGLEETQPLFGCELLFYGNQSWTLGRYKSADEVVRAVPRNKAGQVNASIALDKLENVSREWMEKCAIVMFVSSDLYSNGLNWCFGLARHSARVTVQSVYRYRTLIESVASSCIRRTLRHELGHLFGCAMDKNRSNTTQALSTHCTNPGCSMRQTMTLRELITLSSQEDPRRCFCEQCLQDMMRFKRSCKIKTATTRKKTHPIVITNARYCTQH